jgi:hypothetical protein
MLPAAHDPLLAYFHPYDIDHRQPWVMHAGVRGRPWLNLLLFVRRKSLTRRIASLLRSCSMGGTYHSFVENHLASSSPAPIQ